MTEKSKFLKGTLEETTKQPGVSEMSFKEKQKGYITLKNFFLGLDSVQQETFIKLIETGVLPSDILESLESNFSEYISRNTDEVIKTLLAGIETSLESSFKAEEQRAALSLPWETGDGTYNS